MMFTTSQMLSICSPRDLMPVMVSVLVFWIWSIFSEAVLDDGETLFHQLAGRLAMLATSSMREATFLDRASESSMVETISFTDAACWLEVVDISREETVRSCMDVVSTSVVRLIRVRRSRVLTMSMLNSTAISPNSSCRSMSCRGMSLL